MAKHYNKRVTLAMLECARLMSTGEYSLGDLAKRYDKDPTTIRRWVLNPEVQEEYRKILKASEFGLVAKARKVLEKGMSSGEGYLALQSAQTALNRYDNSVMGEDKQEVTITITGYNPAPGMPDRSESDD